MMEQPEDAAARQHLSFPACVAWSLALSSGVAFAGAAATEEYVFRGEVADGVSYLLIVLGLMLLASSLVIAGYVIAKTPAPSGTASSNGATDPAPAGPNE